MSPLRRSGSVIPTEAEGSDLGKCMRSGGLRAQIETGPAHARPFAHKRTRTRFKSDPSVPLRSSRDDSSHAGSGPSETPHPKNPAAHRPPLGTDRDSPIAIRGCMQ